MLKGKIPHIPFYKIQKNEFRTLIGVNRWNTVFCTSFCTDKEFSLLTLIFSAVKAYPVFHRVCRLRPQTGGKVVRSKPLATGNHHGRRNHRKTEIGVHPCHRRVGKSNCHFGPSAVGQSVRRRVKGHQLVTIGTMDTVLVHPREVFRVAVVGCASAIVLMHNHPSGDSAPSEADIKVTRDLIRAGQLLKIDVIDHVIIGNAGRSSLREAGFFY
jgi:hypothetical protein